MAENEMYQDLLNGDRVALGKAITLLESRRQEDQAEGIALLVWAQEQMKSAMRVAVTGVPGSGKSSLIECLGLHCIKMGKRVAVLAVDPSSKRSGGSILGDKTRMLELSKAEGAFIRPTAAGSYLGGVAERTTEAITLCEAAGFNVIFVETVGVGQSETLVSEMVDCNLLLMLAGTGDELQAYKRGITEVADVVCFHKADAEQRSEVEKAAQTFKMALHMFPKKEHEEDLNVVLASSLERSGIEELWQNLDAFFQGITQSGWKENNRKRQDKNWLLRRVRETILRRALGNNETSQSIDEGLESLEKGNKKSAAVLANLKI